jgi:hypothetical protein
MVRTVIVANRIERSLRRETLDRTARRFGATLSFEPPSVAPDDRNPLADGERREAGIAIAVLRAGPFDDSCLRRALVLSDVLRRRDPLLRVGVDKVEGEVFAHAWVEIDGFALDPLRDRDFATLQPATKEQDR